MSLLSETAASKLEDRQRRYLTIAREEIDRLNRMIDNLVEVARMDSGKTTLRLDGVDLPELLSVAIESLSLLVSKRNLTIERNIPPRLPQMSRRPRPAAAGLQQPARQRHQVFAARRHHPRRHRSRRPRTPLLGDRGTLPDTGYVQITVADDGPGIPAEFLERIFGKFERVDPHGPGIGLGLAIVRSIVEMHHGKVWAESHLGEGASFNLILPIKENS